MFYEFDRRDFIELQEAARLTGVQSFANVESEELRRIALKIFQDETGSLGEGLVPWQLRWLTKLDQLFLLRPPDSPGYFFAGGVFRMPDHGQTMRTLSVTGLGVTPLAALSAAAGELAEFESIYGPDERVLRALSHSRPRQTKSIEFDNRGLTPSSDGSPRSDWIPANSISGAPRVVVLADHVFNDPRHETPVNRLVPLSEGCGAGMDIESAITHGVLELVERDAFCLWWYGGLPPRRIDFATLGTFDFGKFRRRIRRGAQTRQEIVLDITTELRVPCVAAVSWDSSGHRIACGTAARPSLASAVKAAFREMCQLEFGYHVVTQKSRQVGEQGLTDYDRAKLTQGDMLNAEELPMLRPSGTLADLTSLHICEGRMAPSALHNRLTEAGIEAYWVDLSRRDEKLHTIKAISPDLQPGTHEVRTQRLLRVLRQTGGTAEFARGTVLL